MAFTDPVIKIAEVDEVATGKIELLADADAISIGAFLIVNGGGAVVKINNARDGDEITFSENLISGGPGPLTQQMWNLLWVHSDGTLPSVTEYTSLVRRVGQPTFLLGPVTLTIT